MAYVKCLMNVVSSTLPDGKTVTPTDDVSILLACAGRTETYTTISALLADATALAGVISSNNAIDYLVRSTTFASDVCADQGAMADIGANNYASDTLLANSTWLTAICGSTYFESVLNVKVPVMTSNTTPSGVASAENAETSYPAWYAFDNNASSFWSSSTTGTTVTAYLQYEFDSDVSVNKVVVTGRSTQSDRTITNTKIERINADTTLTTLINDNTAHIASTPYTLIFTNNSKVNKYRATFTMTRASATHLQIQELQFYGRADV